MVFTKNLKPFGMNTMYIKKTDSDAPKIAVIGGGAAGAGMTEAIKTLAEKIDGYIGCTFMGLSALPNSYDRFLGMQGMHGHYASSMANKEADLVLGVGVRFSDRATGNTAKYCRNAKAHILGKIFKQNFVMVVGHCKDSATKHKADSIFKGLCRVDNVALFKALSFREG